MLTSILVYPIMVYYSSASYHQIGFLKLALKTARNIRNKIPIYSNILLYNLNFILFIQILI